jgi:putative DNA primase/helicase
MNSSEIQAIAAEAIPLLENILPDILPGGRLAGREYCCADLSGGNGDSCKVNIVTGKWSDFAVTGEAGGDPVSLLAAIRKCSQSDAAAELASIIGSTSTSTEQRKTATKEIWTPILPVPSDAPSPPLKHYQHGEPVKIHEYRNLDGLLLQIVHRYEFPPENPGEKNKKQFAPVTFCRNESGPTEWRFQALPEKRPLYGLEFLADTVKHILVVEGENACNAARRLLGDSIPVITWSGGSNAVYKTDWTPVKGLRLCMWPDADTPGGKAGLSVVEEAMKAGAESVNIVVPPSDVFEGFDLADAEYQGWSREKVMQFLKKSVFPEEFKRLKPEAAVASSSVSINTQKVTCVSNISDAWPQPVLFGEIQTPDIQPSLLPGWLGEYTAAVAANTQTPPAMSVMMALSTVAACIQKRFQVARTAEHIEPLTIWTTTALPPASRKTAVVNAFTSPLTSWEKDQFESGKAERSRIAVARSVLEERVKLLQTKAVKTDNASDRTSLIEEACKLREDIPELGASPRIFTSDVTAERLQCLMMEQGERMAVISDEGGVFAVMAGLYNGGKANIDIFLKGHAGSAVRVDRQGREAYLDDPALTFGLCIQPDIIRRLSETSFRGNGCLARFIFCLPASNIGNRTAHTISIPESLKTAYQSGIHALLNISPVKNEQGKEQARTITLDQGAAQAWEAFFMFMESNMGEGKELEPIQDWAGKLAGAALRIAGIMTVVERGESAKVITEGTMTKALELCELLITHARAAFDLIDDDDSQNDAKHVYRWILEKGELSFRRRDAQQELTRFREVDRLEKALVVLAKRYIVSEPEMIKSESGRGMPSIVHHVNPALFER